MLSWPLTVVIISNSTGGEINDRYSTLLAMMLARWVNYTLFPRIPPQQQLLRSRSEPVNDDAAHVRDLVARISHPVAYACSSRLHRLRMSCPTRHDTSWAKSPEFEFEFYGIGVWGPKFSYHHSFMWMKKKSFINYHLFLSFEPSSTVHVPSMLAANRQLNAKLLKKLALNVRVSEADVEFQALTLVQQRGKFWAIEEPAGGHFEFRATRCYGSSFSR